MSWVCRDCYAKFPTPHEILHTDSERDKWRECCPACYSSNISQSLSRKEDKE